MRLKNRFVSGLLAVCMVISLTISVSAENEKVFVFKYAEKEITVNGDVDGQKAKTISDSINNNEEIFTRGNFFCLFGHSLSHMIVIETAHCYYATALLIKEELTIN